MAENKRRPHPYGDWRAYLVGDERGEVASLEARIERHKNALRALSVDISFVRNRAMQRRRYSAAPPKDTQ